MGENSLPKATRINMAKNEPRDYMAGTNIMIIGRNDSLQSVYIQMSEPALTVDFVSRGILLSDLFKTTAPETYGLTGGVVLERSAGKVIGIYVGAKEGNTFCSKITNMQ